MSIKLPSVLSVQRGTIISDGIMSSIILKNGETTFRRIHVVRHGIRGTLPDKKKDSVSNLQRTESAKTAADAEGLDVSFSFRTIPARRNLLFACSEPAYRQALEGFIARFFQPDVPEFQEVCRRYARNILNGRWLWRNRILGEVTVEAKGADEVVYRSNGSRLRDFADYTPDETALAQDVIAAGLLGAGAPSVYVKGRVIFGFAGQVEVFPSQNMITSKPDGFARSLYKVDAVPLRDLMKIMNTARKDGEDAGDFLADMIVMGEAALRDQKIGNAIRTIDTWYPASDGTPIPIEPNGASLERNEVLRTGKSAANKLLVLVDEMDRGETFNPDAAFLIALLVRGGVFSEKQ